MWKCCEKCTHEQKVKGCNNGKSPICPDLNREAKAKVSHLEVRLTGMHKLYAGLEAELKKRDEERIGVTCPVCGWERKYERGIGGATGKGPCKACDDWLLGHEQEWGDVLRGLAESDKKKKKE